MSELMFSYSVARVIDHEGGARFVKHPQDPGGATKWGISLNFARSASKAILDVDGDGDIDEQDIICLPRDVAERVYKECFWDIVKADRLPGGLSHMVFDMAVNMGVPRAGRLLQRSITAIGGASLVDDGVIGEKTTAAAMRMGNDLSPLLVELTARRVMKYAEFKAYPTFGLGWVRRSQRVFLESFGGPI